MKKTALIIVLFLPLFTSCMIFGGRKEFISDSIPRETDLPGWNSEKPVRTARGDSIKDINAAYRDNGAVEYSDIIFRSVSDPERQILVEIISFDRAINAFGMFSIERGFIAANRMETQYMYLTDRAVYKIKESFYIKAASTHDGDSRVLRQIADHISDNLPGYPDAGVTFPDYINAVPGNVNNSDLIYYPGNNDTAQEVSQFFVRQKRYGGKIRLVFFAKTGSNKTSINRYLNPIIKGGAFTLYRTEPLKMLYLKSENQITMVTAYRDWFVGTSMTETMEEAETTVYSLLKNIDEFDSAAR